MRAEIEAKERREKADTKKRFGSSGGGGGGGGGRDQQQNGQHGLRAGGKVDKFTVGRGGGEEEEGWKRRKIIADVV